MTRPRPHRPQSLLIFLIAVLLFSAAACYDDDTVLGSIMFTANADCEIRLFDSHGREIAHDHYETEKEPFVVQMKRSGVFVVHAVAGNKTIKEPLTFVRDNIEHYIEF